MKEGEKIKEVCEILCVRACTGHSYPSLSVMNIYLRRYSVVVHSQRLKYCVLK
jgi:hypothetical protein